MSFKITIEETSSKTEPREEYVKTSNTGNPKDGGPIYEWQKGDHIVERNHTVYEQRVDELDIWNVIEAVNAGPRPKIPNTVGTS